MLLKHSKTSEDLIASISKIKSSKKLLEQSIHEKLIKNQQFNHQSHTNIQNFEVKAKLRREKSIDNLENRLRYQKEMDDVADRRLMEMEEIQNKKKQYLEKKIEEINNRNAMRVQQLKNIEEKVLKKITFELQKNELKEKKLRQNYQKIKNEEKKIQQTKAYQQNAAIEDWKVLQKQKWKLESIAKDHQEKQNKLIVQKNPTIVKNEKKELDSKIPKLPNQKQYKESKQAKVLDPKSLGNAYLEHSKKLSKEVKPKKSNKNLWNVNLKMIGYNSEMVEKISRNTGDLSKYATVQPIQQINQNPKESNEINQVELKRVQRKFQLKQDQETKEYLRQIKQNLKELEKNRKKDNPEITFSDNQENDKKAEDQPPNQIKPDNAESKSNKIEH